PSGAPTPRGQAQIRPSTPPHAATLPQTQTPRHCRILPSLLPPTSLFPTPPPPDHTQDPTCHPNPAQRLSDLTLPASSTVPPPHAAALSLTLRCRGSSARQALPADELQEPLRRPRRRPDGAVAPDAAAPAPAPAQGPGVGRRAAERARHAAAQVGRGGRQWGARQARGEAGGRAWTRPAGEGAGRVGE
uniref:Uncharacterized protein n=1 Tax=Aegilops tauschii subsp. strangulata TaxID=200361 RepID=A0A453D064_AEGTS